MNCTEIGSSESASVRRWPGLESEESWVPVGSYLPPVWWLTGLKTGHYSASSILYRNMPGSVPSVAPAELPRELKKPVGLLALARTLRSCDGMPSVRPRRLESTP